MLVSESSVHGVGIEAWCVDLYKLLKYPLSEELTLRKHELEKKLDFESTITNFQTLSGKI